MGRGTCLRTEHASHSRGDSLWLRHSSPCDGEWLRRGASIDGKRQHGLLAGDQIRRQDQAVIIADRVKTRNGNSEVKRSRVSAEVTAFDIETDEGLIVFTSQGLGGGETVHIE